ncbi:MAG: MaoC/PaaZ C-terminal domain-containing protein [Pseudomonadota bacterium]|nr:MaoC/PaaZ C-terminal domain-containing protein [Pseudomonadota bacterium]
MITSEKSNNHEMAYEDYVNGQIIFYGSYLLTADEIIEYGKQWDPLPFHINEDAAAESAHGGLIASGAHLIAIRIKLIQQSGINPYVIATMGWDNVRFKLPGRPNDRITLTSKCLKKRQSKSRPNCGIVTMYFEMTNADNNLVMSLNDTILIRTRENSKLIQTKRRNNK